MRMWFNIYQHTSYHIIISHTYTHCIPTIIFTITTALLVTASAIPKYFCHDVLDDEFIKFCFIEARVVIWRDGVANVVVARRVIVRRVGIMIGEKKEEEEREKTTENNTEYNMNRMRLQLSMRFDDAVSLLVCRIHERERQMTTTCWLKWWMNKPNAKSLQTNENKNTKQTKSAVFWPSTQMNEWMNDCSMHTTHSYQARLHERAPVCCEWTYLMHVFFGVSECVHSLQTAVWWHVFIPRYASQQRSKRKCAKLHSRQVMDALFTRSTSSMLAAIDRSLEYRH